MNISCSSVISPSFLASLYPDIQTVISIAAVGAMTKALPTSGQQQVMEELPSTLMVIGR